MSPGIRKAVLVLHLTVSVGWIGGVVAYLALGIAATTSEDAETIRGSWTAMEVIGWYALVPVAVASVLTGVVMALGTRWGLVRHYWVVVSLVLTVVATAVLVLHMPTVSATADAVRAATHAGGGSYGGDLFHPAVGLVVLLLIQALNVYKPAGMTRYGRRKQRDARAAVG